MRNPGTRNPISQTRAPRLSRAASAIRLRLFSLCLLLAMAAPGCIGGADVREPHSGVALEKTRWVFPLFHYEEREGRKTFTPFFLIPIPVGQRSAAIAESSATRREGGVVSLGRVDRRGNVKRGSGREINTLQVSGEDSPAWGRAERDPPPAVASIPPPVRTDGTVQPGVWDSSLPIPPVASLALADPTARSHQVRPGDTLFALATRYYGNGKQWQRIADANRDRMPSPERLPIGVQLRIP